MPTAKFVTSDLHVREISSESMGMPVSRRKSVLSAVAFVITCSVCDIHSIRPQVTRSENPAKAGIMLN